MTQSAYENLVKGLKPEVILKEFPDVIPISNNTPNTSKPTSSSSSSIPSTADTDKTLFLGQDAEQIKLMEEVCIVVDWNDTPVGAGSKKTCKWDISKYHRSNYNKQNILE